jgi:deoxyribodipyrimidine photo-lyase
LADRPVIFWFRDDLRLEDNAGLAAAAGTNRPLVAVYLLDEETAGTRPLGGAARWWLGRSLISLADQIAALGGQLVLRRGPADREIPRLVRETGARAVYWNRRYGPVRHADAILKASLAADGVDALSCRASLLVEPFDLSPERGKYPAGGYKVFSPFWKAARQVYRPTAAHKAPRRFTDPGVASDDVRSWALFPSAPDWSTGLAETWTPGEPSARARLQAFLDEQIEGYAARRDRPDIDGTSRLSPHLRFGEIGPDQVWRAATAAADRSAPASDVEKFLAELGWREFSWHLLYHDPELHRLSWRRTYEQVDWRDPAEAGFRAWTRGRTGFPIVDAGMRQLWRTGWMHNRVRMIAASFLAKDMLVHWRHGEAWFWDTLVDADEANNPASWQWVAGTGADAAPYFRVFNPSAQAEKFDPDGEYVRRWVPEADDPSVYPGPMLDHGAARERRIGAFRAAAGGEAAA